MSGLRKAVSDLAPITVPNISHCSSVLSTNVWTSKEGIYGPGGMEMVLICKRECQKIFRRRPTMTNTKYHVACALHHLSQ